MTVEKQHTLKQAVSCDGIGLHSGKMVVMTLLPAPADTGIVFIRTDMEGRPQVHAVASNMYAWQPPGPLPSPVEVAPA